MDMNETLLTEIDHFLNETGMAAYRFGFLAVKNGRLVERLRAGVTPHGKTVRLWPETVKQIRAFIRSERAKRQRAA